jgi:hypothetical protein
MHEESAMSQVWKWLLYVGILACLAGFVGCGAGPMTDDEYDAMLSCGPDKPLVLPERKVTYEADIKPMLAQHCGSCHKSGGSAPFVFDTYEEAALLKHLIASVTKSRRMPPWAPADCCNAYVQERRLRPEQIATIQAWVKQGARKGNVPAEPAPQPLKEPALREDVVLKMPRPFRPKKQFGTSELRCFMMDWPVKGKRFITGFDVKPGNPKLVHHILVNVIPPEHVKSFEALDARDARQGWDCYGQGIDLRKGVGIGGWAPGITAVTYPDGIGIPIEPGSKIMINMHYDMSQGDGLDQTSLAFRLEKEVPRRAYNFAVSHPQWLLSGGMKIEANQSMTKHHMRMDLTAAIGVDKLTLYAINLHMHERGKRGSVVLERANGTKECLLHIPDFPFLWQETYYLKQPVVIEPGDKIYLECRWDNTAANQPIVEGKKVASQTLDWGTDKEMCSAFLLLAEGGTAQ